MNLLLQRDSSCGDTTWTAAGNSLKKKKNLDETGLEILGCRHSLAQAAVNMFYGEIYGYAHYLQKEYLLSRSVDFFWCDVICKYWPWLKKKDSFAAAMKPALSVMHAKAHSWSCQVVEYYCCKFYYCGNNVQGLFFIALGIVMQQ